MLIEPKTYIRKPFAVDAVKVTEDNLAHIAEWCQGTLRGLGPDEKTYVKVRVAHALNERQTKAFPGDWVLYAVTGFKVYTEKAFAKNFQLETPPAPTQTELTTPVAGVVSTTDDA